MAVVEPAWISCFGRIGFVGVVIELSDLVSASKYRDSREGKKESMKGYIVADSAADTVCIAFVVKTFRFLARDAVVPQSSDSSVSVFM